MTHFVSINIMKKNNNNSTKTLKIVWKFLGIFFLGTSDTFFFKYNFNLLKKKKIVNYIQMSKKCVLSLNLAFLNKLHVW